MREQSTVDLYAPLPAETLIGAPFDLVVENWESGQPVQNVDPKLRSRASAIFEAVASLTEHPRLKDLQTAVATDNEHALGALVELNFYLGEACDALMTRCKRWKVQRRWRALHHEAALAVRLTAAAGRDAQSALAWFLLATADRANGDNKWAIDAFRMAIKAALTVPDDHILAVANDNLGNALVAVGRLDDALRCYDEASLHELDPKGRAAIKINKSMVLASLGELHLAAQAQKEAIAELEGAGVITKRDLGVALDNAAWMLIELAEPESALKMMERARGCFGPDNRGDQVINALNRSLAFIALGEMDAAAQAFVEAHDLAFEHARQNIDPERYRRGFLASLAKRLRPPDDAYRLFIAGLIAKDANRVEQALQLFQSAAQRARELGDEALALRVIANAGAVLGDAGQVEKALSMLTEVREAASARGLALPELMATGSIAALAATGVEIRDRFGVLGNWATYVTLKKIHAQVVAEAGLDPETTQVETYDPGTDANGLAHLAEYHHADDLAIRYYQEAAEKSQAVQDWFGLANRLGGLAVALARRGRLEESTVVAQKLKALLSKGVLSERGQLVAHRALGLQAVQHDRQAAIEHLRHTCTLSEALSQRIGPGPGRADFARQIRDLHHQLARLLRESGDTRAAFEALQGEKGRRLIDALAALRPGGAPVHDAPPKASEVLTLIDHLGGAEPTVLVDLAVEAEGLTAYLVGEGRVQTVVASGVPANLAVEQGDVREREARLAKVCLSEPLLSDLAEAVTSKIPKGRRLLLVPDGFLHNLPLHAVPVQGRPWCEHFSIGYLPAAGVLRFAPSHRSPVGCSLVAGDSRGDLPFAAAECAEVARALGDMPLVGPQCSRAAIEEKLRAGELDVVHLAVHGRGDARRGGRASLLLADGVGGTEWVAFDELATFPWRAELVVFSGCSTAVSGPRHGHQLIGVARAAAERGAAAVIACLWPVGDQAASVLMTAFYRELVSRRASGPVDLRVVLDVARAALRAWLLSASAGRAGRRDGRDVEPMATAAKPRVEPEVADALAWAPFILVGDPMLGN